MSASLMVQKRVAAALAGVAGVTGVYDGPPVDAVPPYLVIGSDLVTDWSTKTEVGHEHRLAINVWDAGPGTAAAKAVMGAVAARLATLGGMQDGHRIVSALLLRQLVLTDAEGWTQGIVEFRVRTVAD
ncbi:DUF3168 domain-containing protein [Polymorphobacter fuscus]|uniref:DUF3168 domain-containing protein n=1 Tax=Sandarakinorhabdus fusca TaxID=1439888 RepID=A0A7C9KV56_9SPHN|nr:DUF3168 domain-containing protein [Polymorphobacter fuscus]KAB7648184.1 DUF3168 domain-containing protein [Polymorphobacter fuscus]MQT15682.1 DUF3168 domain-containing protein [Polymorphobacter fuscus]NJC08047.1 hypothetical protein [Polymorphobacter fuscus]